LAFATLGLLSSSAILVHFFDGLIEMHFHFFVMVAVVAVYQSWPPFLVALAFVLLHHGVIGAVAPGEVYNHAAARQHAWMWALVHGCFVLAESVACLTYWRVSENAVGREHAARARLEKAHRELAQAQELSGIGSWDWDVASGTVTWSDQLYALAGVDASTFTPTVASFLELVDPHDRARVQQLIVAAHNEQTPLDYECRLVRPDGAVRIIHALGEYVTAADGTLLRMFGTCHDVTERKLLQAEIEHLAFHDPLTGLANRKLFLDRLGHALGVQDRSGRRCAVLFIDLDDFKQINDTFGHNAGDELLCEVARRLERAVRDADTIARLGGDEFALLWEDVDVETVTRIAERIEAELRPPIELQGETVTIRSSIGIAVAEPRTSAEAILRDADAAMYTVKTGGGHSHGIFPSTAAISSA
jgi:diguanylate cyclase (GGDEF)-like protein